MNKIALIGNGYWGKILYSKLQNYNIDIITRNNYNEFLKNNKIYNLFIITTPENKHIDNIKDILINKCLENSLIFCEKPFSKDINSFDILKKNKIYISDIFLYNSKYLYIKDICKKNIITELSIKTYNNSISQKDDILYDLLYHDLYMVMNITNIYDINEIQINYYDDNELNLSFKINNININLFYSRKEIYKTKEVKLKTENTIFDYDLNYDKNEPDAIENFFNCILTKKYNLEYNNMLAKSCITNIEKIIDKLQSTIMIIGGGIYGCILAIELSKNNNNIILNEKNNDILQETTKYNLWRIHKGYHYPRCNYTAQLCKKSYKLFYEKYSTCLIKYKHIYCIAKYNSKITTNEYINFMNHNDLSYNQISNLTEFNENQIDSTFMVDERLYNISKLNTLITYNLKKQKIKLNINKEIKEYNNKYCNTILTSYWNNNNIINNNIIYEYQICEVCIIKLPKNFKNMSITIMDGPFISLNPYGDYFAVYDVKNTILYKETNSSFKIPELYKEIINKGIINTFKLSKHKLTLENFSKFFKTKFQYMGSQYSIRVINKNSKDTRKYSIDKLTTNMYSTFSSKVDVSILAANELNKILNKTN
jgi:hypothetical protein